MTKNPVCPTCGSINTTEIVGFGKENKLICHACDCEWWESRRKSENVRAYEWFCRQLFKKSSQIIEIRILGSGSLCSIWDGGTVDDELGQGMVKVLGWQHMPEMTRKGFANNANCSKAGKGGE